MGVDRPALGPWSFDRNAVGEVISQTDERGITRTVSHDNIYRPIYIGHPNDPDIVLNYDENGDIGALTSYSRLAGLVTRDVDGRLRKVLETRELDGLSWTMQWGFDSQDRIIQKVYPDGEIVNYGRNKRGLVESLTGD